MKKGFIFLKTQKGYLSRGDEDVYSHPNFRYKFYVTRYRKGDESLCGFYTGDKNEELLDTKTERNVKDDFRPDKTLEMWADSAFKELVGKNSHLYH